ncbi:restriction endonuclease [Sphingomonas sp. S1-29]|uniref:restriction endonuclease n=1 Tax=Sphingomonas sp. S1-29 TaxID=2991074 RepID=UPI00223FBCE3|nr:restriction endonuclease [Sphingomonas sp. S1-29]UZK70750.1 restriction endonuclease [Sphingomonas sp. S1-29]
MHRPRPADYNLPPSYDWRANKGRIQSRESAVGCIGAAAGWGGGCAMGVLILNNLNEQIGGWTWVLAPMVFFVALAGSGYFTQSLVKPLFLTIQDENGKKYGKDLEAFEYHSLETGVGFWKPMKGIAFERAVMKLFISRGCKAQMTKTTGDGGVDLRLSIAGNSYWCQCKGHAKPIGVAPIREIAGVCSKGANRPMVISTNGYTRPAIEAARELGVILLDTNDLVRIARLDNINAL